MKNPSGRLWRWTMRLQAFHYDIEHRKGKSNVVPDALSRSLVESFECVGNREGINDWYSEICEGVKKNNDNFPEYKIENGNLYRHCKTRKKFGLRKSKWKLVVPPENRSEIYKEYHDNPLAGHLGFQKTLSKISSLFYWPRMSIDIRQYVQDCDICKASKPSNKKNKVPMGSLKPASSPWELISLDFLGPYPRSKEGNTMILVICDWFSKYVVARALRNANAKSLVKVLEKDIFLTFGVPKIVWSDNGRQIVSKEMEQLLMKYKVKHYKTPLYSPQSNHAERVNKVITSSLRAYIKDDHRDWDKNLLQVVCAINTSVHESTKYTPYFINFGREMNLAGEGIARDVLNKNQDASKWENELDNVRSEVRKNLEKAHERESKYYNTRSKPVIFDPGQIVWRKNFQLSDASNSISAKLLPKNIKCKIISRVGSVYEVEDVLTKKRGKYDVQHLTKK